MAETALPITQSKKRTLAVSLRVKLLISFTLLFAVIFAGAFYWFYNFAATRATNRLIDDLFVLADGTAQGINGDDVETILADAVPNDEGFSDHPLYQALAQWLGTIKEVDPRAGLAVMIRGDEPDEYLVVVNGGVVTDPENAPPFMDSFTLEEPLPEFDILFSGGDPDDRFVFGPYEDPYGRWISGYRTIRNAAGEPIAVLGIDYEAEYYYSVRESVQNAAIPAFLLTYVVVFAAVFFISDFFTRRIRVLTRMAGKVSEGNYEQDFDVLTQNRLHDEINTLADVFELMVDKVRQREEKLKAQVMELQIILDTSKRDEQVIEIVESDFFRDLRHKATNMRNRRFHLPEEDFDDEAGESAEPAGESQAELQAESQAESQPESRAESETEAQPANTTSDTTPS